MPAFGKNGIVNLNQNSPKEIFNVIKEDGSVVGTSDDRNNAELLKSSLEKQMNCNLTIQEKTLTCI